jgi:hypothetical protein
MQVVPRTIVRPESKDSGRFCLEKGEGIMSFICVDFYGARQMADEIAAMGADCGRMAEETGLEELTKLRADLEGIAADVRRACDQRENQDNTTLRELRPDYKEVLK